MTSRYSLPHRTGRTWFVLFLLAFACASPALKGDNIALTANGNALIVTGDGREVFQLTAPEIGQMGSIFTTNGGIFDGGYRFQTFFQFRFTSPGGIGAADGITFTLQTEGPNALGGGGGSLGYSGITPSVGVSFVTFQNYWDIADNAVGMVTNGNYVPITQEVPYGNTDCLSPTGVFGCMGNGDLWSVWIEYDGEYLTVELADDSTVQPAPLIKAALNIPSILGGKQAYVGFTGATGNGYEFHDVSAWKFVRDH